MLFMMLFLMIFNIFLINTGDVIFTIGSLKIYSGALLQSAYIFIRLVLIITMTTILTSSTKPLDLTLAIENLLNPLKRFGFPAHELAMMISIELSFIPDLLDEAKKKKIKIDFKKLSEILGIPVVGTTAKKKKTLEHLKNVIYDVSIGKIKCTPQNIEYTENINEEGKVERRGQAAGCYPDRRTGRRNA